MHRWPKSNLKLFLSQYDTPNMDVFTSQLVSISSTEMEASTVSPLSLLDKYFIPDSIISRCSSIGNFLKMDVKD